MKRNNYLKNPSIILSILIALFLINAAFARVYTGYLVLTAQAQINSFNYTTVKGNLTIEEAVDNDITTLNGLNELKYVGGNFSFSAVNKIILLK